MGEWVQGVGNGVKEWQSLLGIKQFRIDGKASQAGRLDYNLAALPLRVAALLESRGSLCKGDVPAYRAT